jgi:hypothetical protein
LPPQPTHCASHHQQCCCALPPTPTVLDAIGGLPLLGGRCSLTALDVFCALRAAGGGWLAAVPVV